MISPKVPDATSACILIATAFIVISPAMSPAIAQTADPAPAAAPSQSTEKDVMEIVVTAQKREENLQDVPIAITVLGGEKLDASTFANFNDALRTIPGFDNNVDLATGGLTISARGVSNSRARGSGASSVAYYIDGMPYGFVRNSFLPNGGDVYDLDRIEFLAGPQGTLYGANALNGVLRILTNDPEINSFAFKGRVMGSATEEGGGNYRGDLAGNVPIIEDKLALRAVVGYRNDSGWIDSPVEEDVNDSKSRYFRAKLKLQATETLSLGFSVWHSELDRGAQDISNDEDRITVLQDQSASERFTVYGVDIEQELPGFTVSSSTGYMKYQAKGIQSGAPLGILFLNNTSPTAEVFSQELNLVSTSTGPWRWSAGAFYRHATDVSAQDSFFFAATPPSTVIRDDFTDRSKSWAVYGEIGRSFFEDTLNLSAGLRYFHDKQAMTVGPRSPQALLGSFGGTSSAVTPRAVATWKASNDVTFYASYSQGFRSGFSQRPEVLSLYPSYTPVEPDKLTNYEVGSKGSLFGGAIRYTAALFYIDWQDLQQSLTLPLPGGQQSTAAVVNANSASGIGAEASLSVQPMEGLRISGGASWNDLEFDSNVISNNAVLFRQGERTLLSPEYTIGGEAEYSRKMAGDFVGRISWGGDYKSPQNTIQRGVASTSQSIFIQRARLALESPKNWTVSFYVDNLNNDKTSPTPAPFPPEWSPRFRPRTMGLMFDYHL